MLLKLVSFKELGQDLAVSELFDIGPMQVIGKNFLAKECCTSEELDTTAKLHVRRHAKCAIDPILKVESFIGVGVIIECRNSIFFT